MAEARAQRLLRGFRAPHPEVRCGTPLELVVGPKGFGADLPARRQFHFAARGILIDQDRFLVVSRDPGIVEPVELAEPAAKSPSNRFKR